MSSTKLALGLIATVAISAVGSHIVRTRPALAATGQTTQRRVAAFDRIELTGAFDATVTVGAREQTVSVTADAATTGRVTTRVAGKTLEVGMRGDSYQPNFVHLSIAVPHLRGFANSGAGSANISGIRDNIEIGNSGAATIDASGRADRETISLDGTGKIDATGVDARDVTVNSSGLGGVYVRGSGNLKLSMSGLGEIRYAGKPTHVQKTIDGLGRITPM